MGRQHRENYCRSLLKAVNTEEDLSFQQRVDIIEADLNDKLVPAEIDVLTMLINAKIAEEDSIEVK